MARRVSVEVEAAARKQKTDSSGFAPGVVYNLPGNSRMIAFSLMELAFFNLAAVAMWPFNMYISVLLVAVALLIPAVMYYYDGKRRPRGIKIDSDGFALTYRGREPLTAHWEDIEFLEKVSNDRGRGDKQVGWIKVKQMKFPFTTGPKAIDAALASYRNKMGVDPPKAKLRK